MKFSQIFRWSVMAVLLIFTWAILLERWAWQKVPTQMSAAAVYTVVALNFVAMVMLVVAPSAWGLSTKTDKN